MYFPQELIRFLRTLYPALVFLLAALAWTSSGVAGSRAEFHSPPSHDPSWRAPASVPDASRE